MTELEKLLICELAALIRGAESAGCSAHTSSVAAGLPSASASPIPSPPSPLTSVRILYRTTDDGMYQVFKVYKNDEVPAFWIGQEVTVHNHSKTILRGKFVLCGNGTDGESVSLKGDERALDSIVATDVMELCE